MEGENNSEDDDLNSKKPPSIIIQKKETKTKVNEKYKNDKSYDFLIGIFSPIIIFTLFFTIIDNLQDHYYEWEDSYGDLYEDFSLNFRTDADYNGVYTLNFNNFKDNITGLDQNERERVDTENLELISVVLFPVMTFYNDYSYPDNQQVCFLDDDESICGYNFMIFFSSENNEINFDEDVPTKIFLHSYNVTNGHENLHKNISVGEFSSDNQTLWLDLGILKYENGENITFFPSLTGKIKSEVPPEPFDPPEIESFCCVLLLCLISGIYLSFKHERKLLGWGLLLSTMLIPIVGAFLSEILSDILS